jgi:hypothetical protein
VHPRTSASGTPWTDQPAALLGWGVIVVVLFAYSLGLDRTFLIDQQNYLDNFAWAVNLDWARAIFSGDSLLKSLVVGVFSEEALWQVWATVLGYVFSPSTAVVVTVCAITLGIGLAVVRLPDPVFPLIIWIMVPVGFAVIGLLQLRQGFAFAVMLYVSLRLNRPVLGTLLAAMIHATFVVALPFALIAWLCGRKHLLMLCLAVGFAFIVAYLGGMLFETFGGRRLKVYSAGETEANSILYVFGALLCALPSLHRLLSPEPSGESAQLSRTLASIATIHVGAIAFVVTSFFVFPLGAGRVGYLTMLLLMPILPTMRRRDTWVGLAVFALLVLYLIYLGTKTYFEGTYNIYFAG